MYEINVSALSASSSHGSVQRHDDLLGGQRVDVPDLPGNRHGVAVDDVEVLLAEQQQTLAGVQTLDPGTAVHVLDLEREAGSYTCVIDRCRVTERLLLKPFKSDIISTGDCRAKETETCLWLKHKYYLKSCLNNLVKI